MRLVALLLYAPFVVMMASGLFAFLGWAWPAEAVRGLIDGPDASLLLWAGGLGFLLHVCAGGFAHTSQMRVADYSVEKNELLVGRVTAQVNWTEPRLYVLGDVQDPLSERALAIETETVLNGLITEWFPGEPIQRIRFSLNGIRRGSLYFDYDIFLVVVGSVVAVLGEYKRLREGIEALLGDVKTIIKRGEAAQYRFPDDVLLDCSNLRLLTTEEFERELFKQTCHRHEVGGPPQSTTSPMLPPSSSDTQSIELPPVVLVSRDPTNQKNPSRENVLTPRG